MKVIRNGQYNNARIVGDKIVINERASRPILEYFLFICEFSSSINLLFDIAERIAKDTGEYPIIKGLSNR